MRSQDDHPKWVEQKLSFSRSREFRNLSYTHYIQYTVGYDDDLFALFSLSPGRWVSTDSSAVDPLDSEDEEDDAYRTVNAYIKGGNEDNEVGSLYEREITRMTSCCV